MALETLGSGVLEGALRSTPLLFAAMLAVRALRREPAALRHRVCAGALLGAALLLGLSGVVRPWWSVPAPILRSAGAPWRVQAARLPAPSVRV